MQNHFTTNLGCTKFAQLKTRPEEARAGSHLFARLVVFAYSLSFIRAVQQVHNMEHLSFQSCPVRALLELDQTSGVCCDNNVRMSGGYISHLLFEDLHCKVGMGDIVNTRAPAAAVGIVHLYYL